MTEQLTQNQIADYQEAFSLFDTDSDGAIQTSELGLIIRSLNFNPTEQQINDMQIETDPDGTGRVEFPDFLALMAQMQPENDPQEELMEAFRVKYKAEFKAQEGSQKFGKDKNNYETPDYKLNFIAFKKQLTSGREALSDDDIQMLSKLVKVNEMQEFFVQDFIQIVTSNMTNLY